MLKKRDLDKFNVFLLVHVDYYFPDGATDRPKDISKIYDNIKTLNEYCQKTGKMIFVSNTYRMSNHIKKMSLLSKYILIDDPKKITSAISEITKIPIENLNVGFGGFKWDACVRDWYLNLVENPLVFEKDFIENWRKQPSVLQKNQKFKFGEIIMDLTDFNCQK